ncbi:MAG: prolyl oligopeptidase family serine peptidase [Acidobacteriota bacterium]
MKALVLLACVGFGMVACSGRSIARTSARPPATQANPVTDVLHGVSVTDNYRWLEGDNAKADDQGQVTPVVSAWTDAQNQYTRDVLDHLPGRKALEDRLRPLMEVGVVSAPAVRHDRFFFSKREGSQNQPVIYWRTGLKGADKVLIDPAVLDPSGLTTVEWFSPSNDGTRLAYGTYRAGDENTTLHLLDVDSGQRLPFEIPDKTQAAQWLPDDSGFLYQNLKNPKDPYSGQVLFHRMGTDRSKDMLLFRQFTKAENAKLATTWGPDGSLSHDGRWLLLGYWVDTKSNDLWLANFDDVLRTGKVTRKVVTVGTAGLASGTVIDNVLYIQTTKGAPKGRVVAAPAATPDEAHWRDIVPERAEAVIEGVSFAKGFIVVTYLKNASNVVEVFDMTGKSLGLVNQPGIGSVGMATEEDRSDAFLTFTSYNYPTSIFHVDLVRPSAPADLWAQPPVPVEPSSVDVEQVWYPSKDGTRISMFLVHKKGLTKNGRTPTLLYGYGGFNINLTPAFSASLFQWFDAGGVYAVPNLRGGGEYGDAWHDAGMLGHKQNVFDDFIAAAEWLMANGYTDASHLAISGGSNGGLLTGTLVTQRPDLFRAAVVAVPLLDMLRYQNFLMARYWVPEYGTAEDPDQFNYLAAYSPYQHVKPGTKYPSVFLTAGEHDTRVHALHARKMAAALQAATTSDPAEKPVLLWVDREAGHGQGKPLNLRLRDAVDQRLFIMWQLGMLDGQ